MSVLVLAAALGAAPQAVPAGKPTPWQAGAVLQELGARLTKVSDALNQLQILTWEGAGARNYAQAAESARKQISALGVAVEHLAKDPERLGRAVRLFVSLQQLEPGLDSLAQAAAKFQGREAATALEDATNALLNYREKFVEYLLEAAEFVEENESVAERELESCRQQLWERSSQPQRGRRRE